MFTNKRLSRKLSSQSGVSLAETLMAVLLVIMISSMVGGAATAAKDGYQKIVQKSQAQLVLSTAIAAVTSELQDARDFTANTDAVTGKSQLLIFTSPRRGGSRLVLKKGSAGGSFENNLVLKPENGDTEIPLLSGAAVGKNLSLVLETVETDSDKITLRIKVKKNYVDAGKTLADQELVIRPIEAPYTETTTPESPSE